MPAAVSYEPIVHMHSNISCLTSAFISLNRKFKDLAHARQSSRTIIYDHVFRLSTGLYYLTG